MSATRRATLFFVMVISPIGVKIAVVVCPIFRSLNRIAVLIGLGGSTREDPITTLLELEGKVDGLP